MLVRDGLAVAEGLRRGLGVDLHPDLGTQESAQGVPLGPGDIRGRECLPYAALGEIVEIHGLGRLLRKAIFTLLRKKRFIRMHFSNRREV